jgi:hypothetical protein
LQFPNPTLQDEMLHVAELHVEVPLAAEQVVPQTPQLLGSDPGFTQIPLHCEVVEEQVKLSPAPCMRYCIRTLALAGGNPELQLEAV